ncbi:HAMP domain-containing protein [Thermoleophilia bacterium SCSIO 60948]|nr:HAMP domain-containing protein [Thermoleophilia bacterium SCSIO 60948]
MLLIALTWLYGRLGHRYPKLFLTLEMLTAIPIAAASLALFSFYFEGPGEDYLLVGAITLATTVLSIILSLRATLPLLDPAERWIAGRRDPESAEAAWRAAAGTPLGMVRRYLWIPIVVCVLPTVIATVILFGLPALAFLPLFAGAMVAVGYVAILHYLVLEMGMRPVLLDIDRGASPRAEAGFAALPLRWKMGISLPLINVIAGLVVASLTGGGESVDLGVDVLIAVAVATTISLELSLLLSKSILGPIAELRRAMERVNDGDYERGVPVTSGDELGELTASFNEMIHGLAERERIRDAFGTYLDEDVADYILSDSFDEGGVERDVTVLFCDVREFTRFAADATPQQIVASLNRLFERIVPLIARNGGHVDKFVGDGLIAVFGAPEPFPDHATRAVRAACEIAHEIESAVERRSPLGLDVGIGINSGRVVAGSIGGGGRLDFSVIGNAVNIASRTEKATRETGDRVLITADTWQQIEGDFEATSRGLFGLRGIDDKVELYAPRFGDRDAVAEPPNDTGRAAPAGDREDAESHGVRAPGRLERLGRR